MCVCMYVCMYVCVSIYRDKGISVEPFNPGLQVPPLSTPPALSNPAQNSKLPFLFFASGLYAILQIALNPINPRALPVNCPKA